MCVRPGGRLAACLVAAGLALVSGGCASVELDGRLAHVPILLGPVKCIGCRPGDVRGVAAAPFSSEAATTITGFAGGHQSALINSAQESSLAALADSSVPSACVGEIHLGEVKASVFHIESIVYSRASYYLGAKGKSVTIANGYCDPRLLPAPVLETSMSANGDVPQ
jgi:hypothetical protein